VSWIILGTIVVVVDEVLALNTSCNVHVREELKHYRTKDSLQFLSWNVFFYRGW